MNRRILYLAASTLTLAACSDQSASPTSPTPQGQQSQTSASSIATSSAKADFVDSLPNPCALLTALDIHQALGMPLPSTEGPDELRPKGSKLVCSYYSAADHTTADMVAQTAVSPMAYCDGLDKDPASRPVSDLGDQATYVTATGMATTVCFKTGGFNMIIWVATEPKTSLPDVVNLARIMISRV